MIARDLSSEERALTFVFRGRLVQAAGVTDGGGGAREHATGHRRTLGDWGECCGCHPPQADAGSLKAVAARPFLSTAAMLR